MNIYRKYRFLFILSLLLFNLFSSHIISQTKFDTIMIDNFKRSFIVHIPVKNSNIYNFPLVIVLHGHGGTGKQIMKESKFIELSDTYSFIAVYPDGIDNGWNDGRESNGNEKYDDVKFISSLINKLIFDYKIDTTRIFATGISNGGIFSLYLALKLPGRLLAIAPVAANIPLNLVKNYHPDYPVSLMLINGSEDPLIKYDGGKVGFKFSKNRGWTISTDSTVLLFKTFDKCLNEPVVLEIPDIDPEDDCDAVKYTYTGGLNNTEVILIKIVNGGHTWPGGSQYLPKFLVGNVCRDFRSADLIWDFFMTRKVR